MNEDVLKGRWRQAAGRIKAKWGPLTDDDLRRRETAEAQVREILH